MISFPNIVLIVGRINDDHVNMLGTGFVVKRDGLIITTAHNLSCDDNNLVILRPHIKNMNEYQDLADHSCIPIPVNITEIDPIKDLAILKLPNINAFQLPPIGNFDDQNVGDEVSIYGFPHCTEGRRALTLQKTNIGAKILISSNGIKSKHAVINTQARPGQSGSLIFSHKNNKIVGILIGAYAPSNSNNVIIQGINPHELHQTTHCISAEYILEMI